MMRPISIGWQHFVKLQVWWKKSPIFPGVLPQKRADNVGRIQNSHGVVTISGLPKVCVRVAGCRVLQCGVLQVLACFRVWQCVAPHMWRQLSVGSLNGKVSDVKELYFWRALLPQKPEDLIPNSQNAKTKTIKELSNLYVCVVDCSVLQCSVLQVAGVSVCCSALHLACGENDQGVLYRASSLLEKRPHFCRALLQKGLDNRRSLLVAPTQY